MNAEVAIKAFFSKLKAAIVKPLIAPPVPNSPAEKPDSAPPLIAFLLFAGITNSFLYRKRELKAIRKRASIISSITLSSILLRKPPKMTNTTEGIPICKSNFLFRPFLKSIILLRLLER